MPSINPYSRFSDPLISNETYIKQPSLKRINSNEALHSVEEAIETPLVFSNPLIVRSISQLPDETIIVYRGTPQGYARGPNLEIAPYGLEINNSEQHSRVFAKCTSTYPQIQPYNPIADRYEVHIYRDGWILTLADGCGLHPTSRLAPAAAMRGFWNHLSERLKNDQDGFKVQKLATYMQDAIEAAHFNIYWDAFLRNKELGYHAHKNEVLENVKLLRENNGATAKDTDGKTDKDLDLMINALKGDYRAQQLLIERKLNTRFYENYAGATTFFSSALIKNGSQSEFPYYLLTVSLGDCKGYAYRDGQLREVTQDNREDISNARDPGGKIGLCTPFPLVIDRRNLQYSLTPCKSKDFLFFMTDGVVDNLDAERIGLKPHFSDNAPHTLNKVQKATGLSDDDFKDLLSLLQFDEKSWSDVPLDQANQAKSKFGQKLLEQMIKNSTDISTANERITNYCKQITSDYREEKPYFTNLFEPSVEPLGKPDHTTCLAIEVV